MRLPPDVRSFFSSLKALLGLYGVTLASPGVASPGILMVMEDGRTFQVNSPIACAYELGPESWLEEVNSAT